MPGAEGLSGEFILNPADKKKKDSLESDIKKHLKHRHKVNFYTSLCINPEGLTFESQEPDEEIVLLVRRDLITNVPWIAAVFLLIIIPPLILVFSNLFAPFFQISPAALFLGALFYYLLVAGFIIIEFAIWYFNVGLVTNKRVIDLNLHGILYKHVSETRLNLIEDVSYGKVGAIRAIFDYGDVLIQTAGTMANFEFLRVPEPARVSRIIADMIGEKPHK
jgi:membrane protein YdbS with pleckstrin-like domain